MSNPDREGCDNVVVEESPTEVNNPETVNVVLVEEPQDAFQKKKRKKTSLVWDEFDEDVHPDGTKTANCQWCKKKLLMNNKGSTTHLIRHLKICTRKQLFDKKQKRIEANTSSEGLAISSANFVYNHAKVREVAAQMVLVHEYPFRHMEHEMFNIFLKTVSPHYQKISRTTSKIDCMTVYELEKKRLTAFLKTIKRVSITTDCWKSGQDVEYMVITGHFVDDWKLHKRILNFVHVPPPCSGIVISDAIYKCLVDWGIEDKVATITVDNASYNDVAVRNLKDNISLRKKLMCDGKLFHVRCTSHIINLLVQDGLKEIQHIIENVRKSVKYLALSEARLILFSQLANQMQIKSKKLILDCSTRWNSTYAMLAAALVFKDVFPKYKERDSGYIHLPSSEDWEKADKVCDFLGVFDQVTTLISGSDYPTSNLFLTEVCGVHEILNEKLLSDNDYIRMMALKMIAKFDKYWGECNLLMAIAAVLDPRYKIMLVNFCFTSLFSSDEVSRNVEIVQEALVELYNEYVASHTNNINASNNSLEESASTTSTNTNGKIVTSIRSKFGSFVKSVDNIQPVKSELDVYLEEGVYICDEGVDAHFCALEWWKANYLKYRILSKLACDILSIPITTVASESAFSAGGRVIDTYRASLGTDTVQALMCGADWVRNLRGFKNSSKV